MQITSSTNLKLIKLLKINFQKISTNANKIFHLRDILTNLKVNRGFVNQMFLNLKNKLINLTLIVEITLNQIVKKNSKNKCKSNLLLTYKLMKTLKINFKQ